MKTTATTTTTAHPRPLLQLPQLRLVAGRQRPLPLPRLLPPGLVQQREQLPGRGPVALQRGDKARGHLPQGGVCCQAVRLQQRAPGGHLRIGERCD